VGNHSLKTATDPGTVAGNPVLDLLSETRSALAVIDMQVDFCAADGFVAGLGLDPTACRNIVPILTTLIDAARSSAVPVLWVYANYDDALVPPTFVRRKREAGIERSCCVPGTKGYEPFGVTPIGGEPQFVKHTYSAFTNPAFETHLRSAGIETLIFAGVQTNVCIEATVRDAYNHGFHVVVAEDCVASHTAPLHDATLQNVRTLLGKVCAGGDVQEAWRHEASNSS